MDCHSNIVHRLHTQVLCHESREAFTNPDHFRIDFVVRPSVCYRHVVVKPNVPAPLSLALFLPCRRYDNLTPTRSS